ncbi:5-formyltetrahydrofolate cyclo-ligase [Pararobbsia alpina]|uniref:5-formyltetrahydrofolate cyclo-ligase n=1 Tax=Pararobbsia alpina TaxID=621374 RepID=UPI001FE6B3D8|nr:5-formyltetrahydrofolate cyclo-ligase [Pararobbsia alpina]
MAHSIACDPRPARSKAALREALLAARQHLPGDDFRDERLTGHIVALLLERAPRCVAAYWPIAGEFDVRPALERWLSMQSDGNAALPVVVARDAPMIFHRWRPGEPVKDGRFRIPVPQSEHPVRPDLLLIPCVGIDRARFRLGYGGGFYDRTLAAIEGPRPFAVGIAFDAGRLDELPREAHDIPLDVGMSESGVW